MAATLDVQSRVLPREAESSPVARHFVRQVLKDWDMTHVEDDAALVVTELVNNAIQHTRTPSIRVSVRRVSQKLIRVAVTDKDRQAPQWRDARPSDTGGRGLTLVDSLSQSWGYTRWPWAKRVWANLEVPDVA
ncbi:ATP-binding protein [Streptomyces sp. NPDC018693]|uniref:ATP-binding protein n=1 Tax=unclassified Streptomyces TaxID=2593676 RepID=UPI0037AB15E4